MKLIVVSVLLFISYVFMLLSMNLVFHGSIKNVYEVKIKDNKNGISYYDFILQILNPSCSFLGKQFKNVVKNAIVILLDVLARISLKVDSKGKPVSFEIGVAFKGGTTTSRIIFREKYVINH